MKTFGAQMRISNFVALALCGALLAATAACRREGAGNAARPGGEGGNGNAASASADQGGDPARLDGEIARLERLAERNPADDGARMDLAKAYLRRADQHRAAGRLREALADYRRAQLSDPDNEEALKNVADLSPQVEGTPQEGEYGEPPPLPVSPNVTDGGATPTPQKSNE
jgi:tetratricopeptide (TPR) repeat protein